jgi:hypothetical protein
MKSFGILLLNYEQERHFFNEMAQKGTQNSFEIYMFCPTDINPLTEEVHGLKYDETSCQWVEEVYPIPSYIYDRCFYQNRAHFKTNYPIINWLKNKKEITFLGYGLPNKWHLYEVFSNHKILSPYIPETIRATSVKSIIDYALTKKKVLCKPESGSQGRGIFALIESNGTLSLRLPKEGKVIEKHFTTLNECEKWLAHVLTLSSYLMQPFLSLSDKDNHPFDIRVFIQKNKEGTWVERGRAVRRGSKNNILSNLHRGGKVGSYSTWLKSMPQRKRSFINTEIDMLIKQATTCLDEHFSPLFEIGLDIGMAQDYSIWLLDTNSKPGRQIILQNKKRLNDDLYEAPFHYCNYLNTVQQ